MYVAHLICTTHPCHPPELTHPSPQPPPAPPCPSTLYLHSLFFAVPPRPGPRPPPIPTPCTCSYDFAPLRVYVYDGRDKLQRPVRETLEGQGRKECAWILEDEGGYRLRQGGRRMFLRKVDSGRDTLFLPTSRPHARFTCPRRGVTRHLLVIQKALTEGRIAIWASAPLDGL